MRRPMTGWMYGAFIGAVVGSIGLAIYPVIIHPYIYPEEWQKLSKKNREDANIRQQDIQPGGMKVWSDPFDRDVKPADK